jgi:hypothetical protein
VFVLYFHTLDSSDWTVCVLYFHTLDSSDWTVCVVLLQYHNTMYHMNITCDIYKSVKDINNNALL